MKNINLALFLEVVRTSALALTVALLVSCGTTVVVQPAAPVVPPLVVKPVDPPVVITPDPVKPPAVTNATPISDGVTYQVVAEDGTLSDGTNLYARLGSQYLATVKVADAGKDCTKPLQAVVTINGAAQLMTLQGSEVLELFISRKMTIFNGATQSEGGNLDYFRRTGGIICGSNNQPRIEFTGPINKYLAAQGQPLVSRRWYNFAKVFNPGEKPTGW
jgi:hypothetical protein